jgi:alkylhydroperoxidase family enzyme
MPGFGPQPPWFESVLAVLAVWRVAHLLALERGPWDAVSRLHAALAGRALGELLACPHCLAMWLALAPAAWLAPGWGEGLLLWLAIAGGASALERALNKPGDNP